MNPHINERSSALPPWGHLCDSHNLFLMVSDSFFLLLSKGSPKGGGLFLRMILIVIWEDFRLSYKRL